jgi:hypothetical protein
MFRTILVDSHITVKIRVTPLEARPAPVVISPALTEVKGSQVEAVAHLEMISAN